MKRRWRVIVILAVVAVSLFAPAAGSAQAPLPVGEAEGVRIIQGRGGAVVVFTKDATSLWKRVAGRRVSVVCVDLPPANDRGVTITTSAEVVMRAPKRGRRLRTGDKMRGTDYCRVSIARRTIRRKGGRTRIGPELIVSIPLTPRGAVFLDEQEKAITLMGLLGFAELVAEERKEKTLPTYEELLAETKNPRARRLIVPLASPADTPPPGRFGYYSDGQEHVAAVTLSASGRRLFLEYAAGDVLHTNVMKYLLERD